MIRAVQTELSYEQRVAAGLCRVCGEARLEQLLALGNVPPVNAFVRPEDVAHERAYPLALGYCVSCTLVQLMQTVPPAELYRDYLHLSSAAASQAAHLQRVADLLRERSLPARPAKILEVGSNDGTLLAHFADQALVVGVDPARNLMSRSRERGVETIPDFMSEVLAARLQEQYGQFDLIIGLNVVAHTEDVLGLVRAVSTLLAPGGVFFMEAAYVLDTVLAGQFDTVYHEHVYCFSLQALKGLLARAGLTVCEAEIIPTQGTSLRIVARRTEEDPAVDGSVPSLLEREWERGLDDLATRREVGPRVERIKQQIAAAVASARRRGPLVGLGAPARGVVILNACTIGPESLQYVVDDTPLKVGRLVPGVHIPVESWQRLQDDAPAGYCLLSWNYREDMLKRLRQMGKHGTVLVPWPKLEVVVL